MLSRLVYDGPEIIAGSLACDGSSLALGTLGGYVRYTYPALELAESHSALFADECAGVQFSGRDLILLGHDEMQSFASPADWKHKLLLMSDSRVAQETALGPGNWALVKALSGDVVVLYDTTENQGVRAMDARTGARLWTRPLSFARLVSLGQGHLAAIDDQLTVLDSSTGAVVGVYDLPLKGSAHWTSVVKNDNAFVLGGFTLPAQDSVFAVWDPQHGVATSVVFPLERFFSRPRLDVLLAEDECCGGPDVFRVAAMRVTNDGATVVAAIGGDGERLGAHLSACAVVLLDAADLSLKYQSVVDEEDGASGLVVADDGSLVVTCCGAVYVADPADFSW